MRVRSLCIALALFVLAAVAQETDGWRLGRVISITNFDDGAFVSVSGAELFHGAVPYDELDCLPVAGSVIRYRIEGRRYMGGYVAHYLLPWRVPCTRKEARYVTPEQLYCGQQEEITFTDNKGRKHSRKREYFRAQRLYFDYFTSTPIPQIQMDGMEKEWSATMEAGKKRCP